MVQALENSLTFLEDIVFVYGKYKPDNKTSPIVLNDLDVLESAGLVKRADGESYTATKTGIRKVMERRDSAYQMNNYPVSIPAEFVEKQLREIDNEKFRVVCDEVRWLMFDWMEYQEKQGINISHNVYLDMWSETFSRVYAKRENKK